MQTHRSTAIVSGAIAVASILAAGAGTAAGAAEVHSGSVHSSTSTLKPVIRLQRVDRTATVHTAAATVNGKNETILVNAQGLPLYYYGPDKPKESLVSGELARLWPPLLSAKPSASGTRGKLTALKVPAGHQVTYNGHFLYTFVEDSTRHVTGQGVSNFTVATPRLRAVGSATKVSSTTPATSSSSGTSDYGY
jgi:predicted lipoprotein with Yx(FWY)xxD motif